MCTSCEIGLRRMPQKTFIDKLILVQIMAWYSEATSHYTWAKADPDLWCHLGSLGHNDSLCHNELSYARNTNIQIRKTHNSTAIYAWCIITVKTNDVYSPFYGGGEWWGGVGGRVGVGLGVGGGVGVGDGDGGGGLLSQWSGRMRIGGRNPEPVGRGYVRTDRIVTTNPDTSVFITIRICHY